jgi:endonuclease III
MIDLTKVPFYDQNTEWLEEFALLAIAVAGKTAVVVAPRMDRLLKDLYTYHNIQPPDPFFAIRHETQAALQLHLMNYGIGCYLTKGKAMNELARSGIDLHSCTVHDLEQLYGIGPKTARFIVLHTRRNERYAVLDTHILKHLSHIGHHVPRTTPSSDRKYREVERLFLKEADAAGMSPAEYDAWVWNSYSRKAKSHV